MKAGQAFRYGADNWKGDETLAKAPSGRKSGPAVNAAKSLWASIQGDPVFMCRVNGWFMLFWVAMIPVSYELGWLKSVVYVSALSLWALVSGHWSAWQAARVEVEQSRQAAEQAESPVEEKVVQAIVEKTTIDQIPE